MTTVLGMKATVQEPEGETQSEKKVAIKMHTHTQVDDDDDDADDDDDDGEVERRWDKWNLGNRRRWQLNDYIRDVFLQKVMDKEEEEEEEEAGEEWLRGKMKRFKVWRNEIGKGNECGEERIIENVDTIVVITSIFMPFSAAISWRVSRV